MTLPNNTSESPDTKMAESALAEMQQMLRRILKPQPVQCPGAPVIAYATGGQDHVDQKELSLDNELDQNSVCGYVSDGEALNASGDGASTISGDVSGDGFHNLSSSTSCTTSEHGSDTEIFSGYSSDMEWSCAPSPDIIDAESSSGSEDDFGRPAYRMSARSAKEMSTKTDVLCQITDYSQDGLVPEDDLRDEGMILHAYHRGKPVYYLPEGMHRELNAMRTETAYGERYVAQPIETCFGRSADDLSEMFRRAVLENNEAQGSESLQEKPLEAADSSEEEQPEGAKASQDEKPESVESSENEQPNNDVRPTGVQSEGTEDSENEKLKGVEPSELEQIKDVVTKDAQVESEQSKTTELAKNKQPENDQAGVDQAEVIDAINKIDLPVNRFFSNAWFKVAKSPLGGYGIFAIKDIPEYTSILLERPFLRLRDLMDEKNNIRIKYERLGLEEKAVFDGLHAYSNRSKDEIIMKFDANSFHLIRGCALLAIATNFNHACYTARNVQYQWDANRKCMVFTTDHKIANGEELLISYGNNHFQLRKNFGFDCQCGAEGSIGSAEIEEILRRERQSLWA